MRNPSPVQTSKRRELVENCKLNQIVQVQASWHSECQGRIVFGSYCFSTHAKRRQVVPKYRCGLDQIVAAVHIQKHNKHTKKQPSQAHPSMFYNASNGCGKALPVKAFVQFLAGASRIRNSWRDFLGVAFHGLKQKQQQICTSMCGHGVSTVSTRDSNMLH